MGQKKIIPVTGEVSTTNDTWTTIATCAIPVDCNVLVERVFATGRATNGTVGEVANGIAVHRFKRVGGVLSPVGSIVYILTFTTGSDSALASCSMQLLASGSNLLLQVKGIGGGSPRNIDWYGGFTVILN